METESRNNREKSNHVIVQVQYNATLNPLTLGSKYLKSSTVQCNLEPFHFRIKIPKEQSPALKYSNRAVNNVLPGNALKSWTLS